MPDAVHPVLLFGSRRAAQVRIDVAIDTVAPPVVWTLSTRVMLCPQAICGICIDQYRVFPGAEKWRENDPHALAAQ